MGGIMATPNLITRGPKAFRSVKPRLLLAQPLLLVPRPRAPSAPPTKTAYPLVARAEAVGSRSVKLPATQNLITRGRRAFRSVKPRLLLAQPLLLVPRPRAPS